MGELFCYTKRINGVGRLSVNRRHSMKDRNAERRKKKENECQGVRGHLYHFTRSPIQGEESIRGFLPHKREVVNFSEGERR